MPHSQTNPPHCIQIAQQKSDAQILSFAAGHCLDYSQVAEDLRVAEDLQTTMSQFANIISASIGAYTVIGDHPNDRVRMGTVSIRFDNSKIYCLGNIDLPSVKMIELFSAAIAVHLVNDHALEYSKEPHGPLVVKFQCLDDSCCVSFADQQNLAVLLAMAKLHDWCEDLEDDGGQLRSVHASNLCIAVYFETYDTRSRDAIDPPEPPEPTTH